MLCGVADCCKEGDLARLVEGLDATGVPLLWKLSCNKLAFSWLLDALLVGVESFRIGGKIGLFTEFVNFPFTRLFLVPLIGAAPTEFGPDSIGDLVSCLTKGCSPAKYVCTEIFVLVLGDDMFMSCPGVPAVALDAGDERLCGLLVL